MEFLADSWILWLLLGVILLVGIRVRRRDKRQVGDINLTPLQNISPRAMLFGFKDGEGDLFFGYLGATLAFSLFLAGFIRWISTIFG